MLAVQWRTTAILSYTWHFVNPKSLGYSTVNPRADLKTARDLHFEMEYIIHFTPLRSPLQSPSVGPMRHQSLRAYSFRSPGHRARLPGRQGHSGVQARDQNPQPTNFGVHPSKLLLGGHCWRLPRLCDTVIKTSTSLTSSSGPQGFSGDIRCELLR